MVARVLSHRPPTVREATHERLVRLRLARGWTQRDLSDLTGLSISAISRAENGGDVYAWVLEKLAEAYGTTMDRLWRGES